MQNEINDSSNFDMKSKDQISSHDSNNNNPSMQIFQTCNTPQIGNNQLLSVSQSSISPTPPKKAKQDAPKRKVNTLLSEQQMNKSLDAKKEGLESNKTDNNNGIY